MTEVDSMAGAWVVPPNQYLANRRERFQAPTRPLSRYISMQDGCRLAADVYLPHDGALAETWPTILIFTPYYRRSRAEAAGELAGSFERLNSLFVTRGYALVVVDVRGTGASFGRRIAFRSPVERDDFREVADWVIEQPWSNGVIGSTGGSYQGAAACFLASTGHPAVKAIAPISAVSDIYNEQLYPGGMLSNVWNKEYCDLVDALDRLDEAQIARFPTRVARDARGPEPVDEDTDGRLVAAALLEHRDNASLHDLIPEWRYRGDGLSSASWLTTDTCSPFHYLKRHARPDLPIYSISGWFDGGGYANGSITRFLTMAGPHDRLLLGCWDHCNGSNASPYREHANPQIDVNAEILRFFDEHLLGLPTGLDAEAPVHYFSAHAEEWKAAPGWPVGTPRKLFLSAEKKLLSRPQQDEKSAGYQAIFTTGTGRASRWEPLGAAAVESYYADWGGREDDFLTFSTEPLATALEITGHIIARLRVSASDVDAALFIYASEVDGDGTSRYITEGMLHLLHRATTPCPEEYRTSWPYRSYARADTAPLTPGEFVSVEIALLPVSWTLAPGSRLRIAIAGADVDHFPIVSQGRPPLLKFVLGGNDGSSLEIPEVNGSRR